MGQEQGHFTPHGRPASPAALSCFAPSRRFASLGPSGFNRFCLRFAARSACKGKGRGKGRGTWDASRPRRRQFQARHAFGVATGMGRPSGKPSGNYRRQKAPRRLPASPVVRRAARSCLLKTSRIHRPRASCSPSVQNDCSAPLLPTSNTWRASVNGVSATLLSLEKNRNESASRCQKRFRHSPLTAANRHVFQDGKGHCNQDGWQTRKEQL